MSKVLQIWLMAAPPAVKFATIASVTEAGNADTPLRDDAMIAGEDSDQRIVDMRARRSLPARHPFGDLLEPPERAWRFGQLRVAFPRRRPRRLVRFRHFPEKRADVVEGAGGGGHETVSS